tara:strand:+ start:112 stop:501 length:390 start_codon:yes stop_codon:yes gene_type:complete
MNIYNLPIKIRIAINLFKDPVGVSETIDKDAIYISPEIRMFKEIFGPDFFLVEKLMKAKDKLNPVPISSIDSYGNIGIGGSVPSSAFAISNDSNSVNFSFEDFKTLRSKIDEWNAEFHDCSRGNFSLLS